MNTNRRWAIVAAATGVACAALGVSVLAGWYWSSPRLLQVSESFAPVQPNAALGFILCGIGLVGVSLSARRAALVLGGAVALLGVLTLCEYLFGVDPGVDRLLLEPSIRVKTSHPGRMGPNTAICFALAGAALVVLGCPAQSGLRFLVLGLLGAGVSALGVAALVGYLTNVEALFGWGDLTDMTLHEALAFVVLSVGARAGGWLAARQYADQVSRYVPAVAAAGFVIGSWVLWQGLVAERKTIALRRTQSEAASVKDVLLTRIGSRAYSLLHIAQRWEFSGPPSEDQFKLDAWLHVRDFKGVKAVAWADSSLRLRWVVPMEKNEHLLGLDLAQEERRKLAMETAMQTRFVALSRSFDQPESGRVSMVFAPIFKGKELAGFIVGVFHLHDLLDFVLTRSVATGYSISVLDGEDEVYRRKDGEGGAAGLEARVDVAPPWAVRIWPGQEFLAAQQSFLPETVLGAGHAVALLLALTLELARKTRERARDLLEANQELTNQIAEKKRAEDSLRAAHDKLEMRVRERTEELSQTNQELKREILERVKIEEERGGLMEQLENEKRRLAEADRRKDEFLALLAHELRNPLAPISSSVEAMRICLGAAAGQGAGSAADPSLQGYLDVLERQVKQMARLIDDLLDVSRITRGKIELRKTRVSIATAVTHAIETTQPLIRGRRIDLSVSLPVEALAVEADPTRLEQSLANILNNAAKYTDPGGRISVVALRQGGDVEIRVRDTGIGIPADMLPSIFNLFAQANPSLDRSQGGLGIGLALAKQLVEMHGGTITALSEGSGKGSEFVVRLPLEAGEAREEEAGTRADADGDGATPSLRVLVVDDNLDAAKVLGQVLNLWGHEVLTVHDGEAALAAAASFKPRLVLLDIGLPGMDGYEVARQLRDSGVQETLLVALTGYGREEDRRRSREAGFDHHLVKPVEPKELRRLLARYASGASPSPPA